MSNHLLLKFVELLVEFDCKKNKLSHKEKKKKKKKKFSKKKKKKKKTKRCMWSNKRKAIKTKTLLFIT